jgi:tripeptide aminopeptidase
MGIKEKFLKYVSYDTQSDSHSETYPSTEKQKKLSMELVNELKALGIDNAYMDQYGYVYATINGTKGFEKKAIGLVAHVDTATEVSGANVKAQVVEKYQGGDIVLNEQLKMVLSPDAFPHLNDCKGQDIVVTDGTTLLGADDKAGVAIIMELAEYVAKNPSFKHPTIRIAFTPDEEVGGGTKYFNVNDFKVDYAYTLDGDEINILNFENFNAAGAELTIRGKSIHPGSAKGKMKNSLLIGMEFQAMLPQFNNPAYTEKYEGFNHLSLMNGGVNETKMEYIIRNHDKNLFERQKEDFQKITDFLNYKYGEGTVTLKLKDSYFNMKELVMKKPQVLDLPTKAMKRLGIEPKFEPIRGGTDGATLSYKGIICPNIGTGGGNYHGPYEYASLTDMNRMVEVLKIMLQDMVSQ